MHCAIAFSHSLRDANDRSCGYVTGEAYFLKDAEPDKEPSSSQVAITPGDEVLALNASPSQSGDVLGGKVSDEDVEKGESSDEKGSNLALRFEGRKASYLLVQQVCCS